MSDWGNPLWGEVNPDDPVPVAPSTGEPSTGGTGGTGSVGGTSGGSEMPPIPPSVGSFTGSASEITSGDSVTLSFSTDNATAVFITGVGVVSGTSVVVTPTTTTTFVLTAISDIGSVSQEFTVVVKSPSAENVEYHQIRRHDREGDGQQIQMSAPINPAVPGWPAIYTENENVIARQPRGNTPTVQLADQSGGYTEGNLLGFDGFGNAKDSGISATSLSGAIGAWIEEIPAGSLNGVNLAFTLSQTPIPGSLQLFLNIQQCEGTDFTIAGAAITFTVAPKARDTGWFQARYQH